MANGSYLGMPFPGRPSLPPLLVLPFPRFEHTIDRPTIALSPLRPLLANGGHVRRDSDDDYKTK